MSRLILICRLYPFLLTFNFLMALAAPPWARAHSVFDDFPLPRSLSLCGEPLPLENRRVWEMLDREFTIAVWDHAQVFMWLKRAGRYFPYIEKELAKAGMPEDLKFLAVAESALLTHIRSKKGAVGPWQFMPHTARRNGLRKDRTLDERRDFERSTQAALKYLKRLKSIFGSWTLALAAYNCGEDCVKRQMKEQKVRDYYKLNLPLETERFVFRIAVTKIIMENPSRYGYSLAPERVYKPINCDEVPVKIRISLHLTDVAKALGTDFKVLRELNPQILGYYLPTGRYKIKVPTGMGRKTANVLKKLTRSAYRRTKRVSSGYYVVRRGDTLSHIAKRTGVPVTDLKKLNRIHGSLIKAGQRLRLTP